MSANAYREPEPMPLAIVEPVKAAPRGLVRANGARCTCSPPWRLTCWWLNIQPNDQWFCSHGYGWVRKYDRSAFREWWWELLHKGDS